MFIGFFPIFIQLYPLLPYISFVVYGPLKTVGASPFVTYCVANFLLLFPVGMFLFDLYVVVDIFRFNSKIFSPLLIFSSKSLWSNSKKANSLLFIYFYQKGPC
jgi:hypothetical protein